MKKLYITFMLSLSAATLFAGGGIHANYETGEITFIKNRKRLPDVAYQQELRSTDAWKKFLAKNGTWFVQFNEENGKPHRAFGKPVPSFGTSAQASALNFALSELSDFNIPVNDLVFTGEASGEKYKYAHFYQQYQGLKVLNSLYTVKMTHDARVILFGADVFNDITIGIQPALGHGAAISKAGENLNGIVTSSTIKGLAVLPVPSYKKNEYKLVYEIITELKGTDGMPARYYTLVDADNGKILYRKNEIMHANTDVETKGTLYPSHPYRPSVNLPLSNLKVVEGGTTYYTDANGYVGLSNSTSASLTVALEGKYSRVNNNGVTPTFTASVNPGTNAITFDNNSNIRERSAYYHVNVVHDFMKTKFPSFTDMDNPLTTNVELTSGNCNAFYDGNSINFYTTSNGCNSLAMVGDVVYHEYGHGINDQYYGSLGGYFGNGAMNEGYADVWALAITNNAVLGTGMDDQDSTVNVRRYDIDKKVYPADIVGEVHADGEIIAGAWWDVHLNFGSLTQMSDLFSSTFNALLTAPDGQEGQLYTDVLIEALTNDDNDADITNGTPRDQQIVDAFAIHGITLLSNATLDHTEVLSSLPGTGIDINASLSGVQYAWANPTPKLFYRINTTPTWTSVNMTNLGGINYKATIPSQAAGTLIAYYVGATDKYNTLANVLPIAANEVNPNIPYFILNGFEVKGTEDFDNFNLGGWMEGIPGDNATTGQWTIDAPIPSYANTGTANVMVQTDMNFTDGGSFCAVTGNASNSGSAIGTEDVDAGATTLESSNLDLSTYVNPVISYYRWYINNPPTGANPGNDYWEVHISNDGSTWTKIERTNVSDKSWRRYAFRVKDYITTSSTVKLRFIASDSLITGAELNGGSIVEAALDDIHIYDEKVTGVEENADFAMSIIPNPAKNEFFVTYPEIDGKVKIEMVNAIGQIVKTIYPPSTSRVMIDVKDLEQGMYFVRFTAGEKSLIKKVSVIK